MRTPALVLICALAACGNGTKASDEIALQTKASAEANAGSGNGGSGNGGNLSATISGAKTARAEINDIGFCVGAPIAQLDNISIFALAGNNGDWGVSITGKQGAPTVGTHAIADGSPTSYTASVVDKSTGKEPAEWQRYEATSGSVSFTAVSPSKVEGTYTIKATPQGPATSGPAVDVTGNFAAPATTGC
ncbi:MAG TPA: hypothetical protein VM100_11625 [Longimicrobiales bacterium]|nr:hypothetical protein [Longimicrobiales bacterium]